jgi:DNA-binding FadR family transcriptional regulator
MAATDPISRVSLVDALMERICADVLSLRFAPGSLLPPERELAEAYGVNRTTLVHALGRLSQVGLVHTRHGSGTQVLDYRRHAGPDVLPMLLAHALAHGSGIDGGWLLELFEVRREVGALVAERAAEHRTKEQVGLLVAQVELISSASNADTVQMAECEVHRLLADACGNRVYGLLVNSLLNAYLPVRQLFVAPFADSAVAATRIRPMVSAVCAGDPEAAWQAADVYLANTQILMLGEA